MKILLALLIIIFITITAWADAVNTDAALQQKLIQKAEFKLNMAEKLTSTANYPKAYDELWEVLSIADSLQNSDIKYKAYQKLAMLYSIFHNSNMAFACIDSMFVHAQLSKNNTHTTSRINLHHSAAITYRMHQNYTQAKEQILLCEHLLDSINTPSNERIYVLTEIAHLNTLTGQLDAAQQILEQISETMPPEHAYSSIVYSMWGDLHTANGNVHQALFNYNKSLKTISKQNIRIGLKVELLEKTAKLNSQLGDYKKALEQMTESKTLGDSLFGSQSSRNKQLFEIKDTYRQTIAYNQRIQKEQQLMLLKAQKDKLNQSVFYLILLFVLSVTAAVIVVWLLKRKHLMEKKLSAQRTAAELEIKKKELAVTALQLTQKDKLLDEIKQGLDKVKATENETSIQQIKGIINVNSTQTWEEFETRFVQVNGDFYDSLSKKHPNLSRNELKLCALIKLNFSSKEMAQLMGVSAESVNKARYRLRKKLDLQRDDNLVSYIYSI